MNTCAANTILVRRLQTSALASSGGRITLFPNPKHTEQLILPLTKEDDGSSLLPRGQTWVVGLVREKVADISGKNGSQLGHRTTHARRAFSLASSRSSAARASCFGGDGEFGVGAHACASACRPALRVLSPRSDASLAPSCRSVGGRRERCQRGYQRRRTKAVVARDRRAAQGRAEFAA